MNDEACRDIGTFSSRHAICDMLGLNLTHPRFALDHIDLGKRQGDTCRGDFVKFNEWGVRLVMCKGGPVQYDDNFAALWPEQSEYRPGRASPQRLYYSSSFKHPTQVLLASLDRFLCDVEAYPDIVTLVRTESDLDRLLACPDRVGLLMGANRSDWFGDAPGILRMFARLGLRMVTISMSGRDLGYDGHDELRSGGRLTQLGVRMLEEMNHCGIIVDIAHTNEICALDAIEVSSKPIIDSHSVPEHFDNSSRSTSDAVMKAIAERGGLLGVMPPISRPAGEVPYEFVSADEITRTVDIIEYSVDIMGIDCVGIGTHFNTACLPWLTEGLMASGYAESDIAAILGGNYIRVLKEVLPVAVEPCDDR